MAHSLSPLIQNVALKSLGEPAVYLAARVKGADLLEVVDCLPKLGALGANVTVPHKVAVRRGCSTLTERAETIGAVNTLLFRDGTVLGDNTDGVGWWESLKEARALYRFERAVVIGAGGAARAVAYTSLAQGVREVVLLNRTVDRAQELVHDLETRFPESSVTSGDLADFSLFLRERTLVVQTTSVGLHGPDAPVMLPLTLPKEVYLSELIYGRETRLLAEFRRLGGACADGLGMLIGQASHALALWLDKEVEEIPVALMFQAARDRLAQG